MANGGTVYCNNVVINVLLYLKNLFLSLFASGFKTLEQLLFNTCMVIMVTYVIKLCWAKLLFLMCLLCFIKPPTYVKVILNLL